MNLLLCFLKFIDNKIDRRMKLKTNVIEVNGTSPVLSIPLTNKFYWGNRSISSCECPLKLANRIIKRLSRRLQFQVRSNFCMRKSARSEFVIQDSCQSSAIRVIDSMTFWLNDLCIDPVVCRLLLFV